MSWPVQDGADLATWSDLLRFLANVPELVVQLVQSNIWGALLTARVRFALRLDHLLKHGMTLRSDCIIWLIHWLLQVLLQELLDLRTHLLLLLKLLDEI